MIQVQVYRYIPELDDQPLIDIYEVEGSFRQRMVLDWRQSARFAPRDSTP